MNVSTSANDAAAAIRRWLPKRFALPIVVTAEGERRTRGGGGLEGGVRCGMAAATVQPGVISVPGRLCVDLVRARAPGPVTLAFDPESRALRVADATRSAVIPDVAAAGAFVDRGIMPTDGVTMLRLQATTLAQAIEQTALAAARTDARPALMGVRVQRQGDGITLLATNGYRLAMRRIPAVTAEAPTGPDQAWVLPATALAEAGRLARKRQGEASRALPAPGAGGWASVGVGWTQIVARLIDAPYPDATQIVERVRQAPTQVQIRAAALAVALPPPRWWRGGTVTLIARDSLDQAELEIAIGTEGKQVRATVPVARHGPPAEVTVDAGYLSDAIQAVGALDGDLTLCIANPEAAFGVMRESGADAVWHIMMPRRP